MIEKREIVGKRKIYREEEDKAGKRKMIDATTYVSLDTIKFYT
jgi:hypothetical protein